MRRWLPVAAGVILVASLAGTGYFSLLRPPWMTAAELLKPLEGNENDEIYPWEVNRGVGNVSSSQITAPSFLIGAWIVDQRVAVGLGHADSAQDLSRRIWLALKDRGMNDEAKPFELDARSRLTKDDQKEAFLEKLQKEASEREASLEKDNTALETDYLALGKWAEAARIAAATRNARFFKSRYNRRFPSYFLRKHSEDFEAGSQLEEVRKPLAGVVQTLGNNDLDAAGFKELERSLDGLIDKFESLAEEDTGLLEEQQQ